VKGREKGKKRKERTDQAGDRCPQDRTRVWPGGGTRAPGEKKERGKKKRGGGEKTPRPPSLSGRTTFLLTTTKRKKGEKKKEKEKGKKGRARPCAQSENIPCVANRAEKEGERGGNALLQQGTKGEGKKKERKEKAIRPRWRGVPACIWGEEEKPPGDCGKKVSFPGSRRTGREEERRKKKKGEGGGKQSDSLLTTFVIGEGEKKEKKKKGSAPYVHKLFIVHLRRTGGGGGKKEKKKKDECSLAIWDLTPARKARKKGRKRDLILEARKRSSIHIKHPTSCSTSATKIERGKKKRGRGGEKSRCSDFSPSPCRTWNPPGRGEKNMGVG